MTPERKKQIQERWKLVMFKHPDSPDWASEHLGVKLTGIEALLYGRQDVEELLAEIERLCIENRDKK